MVSAANNNLNSSSSMSPRNGAAAQSRREVSSPWNQIVRGQSEPTTTTIAAAPIEPIASVSVAPPVSTVEGEERSGEASGQVNGGKSPAWKRPSNGSSSSEVGPVMGASSWPSLSETTKAPSSKSSSDSLKSLGDAPSSSSITVSQGISNASVSAPMQVSRPSSNPTPNYSRQRSFKRNGVLGSAANGAVSQPSAQGWFTDLPSYNNSPRGQHHKNGSAGQNHSGPDNLSQRDSYRNQNGNHHQGHGGRRNQEHGNHNWGFQRSFNGRDGNGQSQRGVPAFVRHAPPPVQPMPPHFMAAQPIQPYGIPVPFPPELSPSFFPNMPFFPVAHVPHVPAVYNASEPPLHIQLQNQIHYYFSDGNLIKDVYLRRCMDPQGFVPLGVIARFRKVTELTDSVQRIVEALQGSPFLEVQGDRIRRRDNGQQWYLAGGSSSAVSSPQPVDINVATQFGNLSFGQSSSGPNGGGWSSQLETAEAESTADSNGQQQSSGVDTVRNRKDSDGANR
ncbi:unnamed protein product [Cochlearia groenlandica]